MRYRLITLIASLCLICSINPTLANETDTQLTDTTLVQSLKTALSQPNAFEDEYVGQVWLAAMSTPLSRWIKDPNERIELLTLIHAEASRANLEPGLILALIQVESAFDCYAVSYAGARGIMQVMPFWKDEIGREEDSLLECATNLRYGTTILAHYLEIEKGSLIKALARYNGSRGQTWYPKRVLTYWHQYWRLGE
ncbi:lytic transglycosylase domain-containing protein [Reinekea marinisedimentorum]|uniref:Transglycosylase-like protein with SLT domain n=1 Tax=Reinekea marinisedimentorum TaxID=230495 RepID=A0A4R3I4G0_9GAMM|nr:lytic transglycosylase domain-containing protein [Reinekea marinisedimentorum]TCS40775.1 transglycosylase-like protein with SLT domain [Reinekea marinisedimentorum]